MSEQEAVSAVTILIVGLGGIALGWWMHGRYSRRGINA